MQGISDILSHRDFDVPPEVIAIKTYVERHYHTSVEVTMSPRGIIVSAPSSGLIESLRLNIRDLQKAADTDKRISFRIG